MSLGLGEDILARECQLGWKLTVFLMQCGKPRIRQTHVRILFNLVMTIVEERNLACADSEGIIVCDILMQAFLDMPHCHLTQLRDSIMEYVTLTNSPSRPVQNPTDDYKSMANRLFPTPSPGINTGSMPPPASVAQTGPYVRLPRMLWIMDPDLSNFLIGFTSSQPVAYEFIIMLITQYVYNNRYRLIDVKNREVTYIRNDGLFRIFHCSYIHRSQLRGILRDHVTPVVEE